MPTARPHSFILQLIHPHSLLHSEDTDKNTGFCHWTTTTQGSSPLFILQAGQISQLCF